MAARKAHMSEKVSIQLNSDPLVAPASLRPERGPRTRQQECEEFQPVWNLQSDPVDDIGGWEGRDGGRLGEACV